MQVSIFKLAKPKRNIGLLVVFALIAFGVGWLVIGPKARTVDFKAVAIDDFTLSNCQPTAKKIEVGIFTSGTKNEFINLDGVWESAQGSCWFRASAVISPETKTFKHRVTLDGKVFTGPETTVSVNSAPTVDLTERVRVRGSVRVFDAMSSAEKRVCANSMMDYFGGPCGDLYISSPFSYPVHCSGRNRYGQIAKGALVAITSAGGNRVGEGTLTDGLWDWDENVSSAKRSGKVVCSFSFEGLTLARKKTGYTIKVGNWEPFVITNSDLEARNFNLDLAIGQ